MATVTIKLDAMTATVKPIVVVKYARKLIQDELKAKGLYGSTVWHENDTETTMHFKITNPYWSMAKAFNVGLFF